MRAGQGYRQENKFGAASLEEMKQRRVKDITIIFRKHVKFQQQSICISLMACFPRVGQHEHGERREGHERDTERWRGREEKATGLKRTSHRVTVSRNPLIFATSGVGSRTHRAMSFATRPDKVTVRFIFYLQGAA